MKKFEFDGIMIEITPADIDGDGKTGGVEKINQHLDGDIFENTKPSETKEMLAEMNKDEIDPATNMSSVDMLSRTPTLALPSMNAVDCISRKSLSFLGSMGREVTRQIKRNSISENGEGRKENIEAIDRKKEDIQRKSGLADHAKSFLGLANG